MHYLMKSKTLFVLASFIMVQYSIQVEAEIFAPYELELNHSASRPAFAAKLGSHSNDDIVIISSDDAHNRWLTIYSINEETKNIEQRDKVALAKNIVAYDLGDKNEIGQQSLYFLTKSRVLRYNPDATEVTNKLMEFSKVSSIYLEERAAFIESRDFMRDINNDKNDDIVLSHFEDLNLWLSGHTSSMAKQSLVIPAKTRVDYLGIRFSDAKVFYQDMNGDGKIDLINAKQGELHVYLQVDGSSFDDDFQRIILRPEIHHDFWWEVIKDDGLGLDPSKLSHRVIHSIKDINADGVPDVIVEFSQGSGVLKQTNDYEFYLGERKSGVISYPKTASTSIVSDKTLSELKLVDLDGDGRLEVLVSAFEISLTKIIGALMSGGIRQDFLVYTLDENSHYHEDPDHEGKVRLNFSLSQGQGGFPLLKIIDINGDNHKDLVYASDSKKIKIQYGLASNEKMFSRSTNKYETKIPEDAHTVIDHDINNDGKQDLIMHYGRLDDEGLSKTLRILITQ
ncbi:MAG: hypothetical protein ACI93R_003736 [Flavobacteriales bacterium]|jgi:hypothetical protein